jgi:hypothetical protein
VERLRCRNFRCSRLAACTHTSGQERTFPILYGMSQMQQFRTFLIFLVHFTYQPTVAIPENKRQSSSPNISEYD